MNRRSRFIAPIFVGVIAGSIAGAAGTSWGDHLDPCELRTVPSEYLEWAGTDARNHCFTGDGKDSIRGYASGDELQAGANGDLVRGATGDDDLTDGQGNYDEDKMCDGSGSDYLNVKDGDGKDVLKLVADASSEAYDHDTSPLDLIDFNEATCPF